MAAVGLWLWSSPARFEQSQQPHYPVPASSTDLPFQCTSMSLFGHSIRISSPRLRVWSLLIYSCFLAPGLNLITPALLFLVIYIGVHSDSWLPFPLGWLFATFIVRMKGVVSVTFGLIFLLVVNVLLLVDNELTISRARQQEQSDSQWTFGQTLALLLLTLPLRDTSMLEIYRRVAGRRELFAAVKDGDIQAVRQIIAEAHIDLDSVDRHGRTALHHALSYGAHGIVQLLVGRGASPNVVDSDGWTPLHFAVKLGWVDIVRQLLDSGADPRAIAKPEEDTNPLYMLPYIFRACCGGRRKHVSTARTPLECARECGSEEIVQLLLERGTNFNRVDDTGNNYSMSTRGYPSMLWRPRADSPVHTAVSSAPRVYPPVPKADLTIPVTSTMA
jgi:hypothetical protein